MLRYIEGYTWEKHLLGEAVKEAAMEAAVADETISATAEQETVLEEQTGKSGKQLWYKKVIHWIRKLFHG